jgi:20S proteasome alpha/beta subunit
VIYHYDPVGSMEELAHSSGGAATCLVQPFLDNQVGKNNRTDKGPEGEGRETTAAAYVYFCF